MPCAWRCSCKQMNRSLMFHNKHVWDQGLLKKMLRTLTKWCTVTRFESTRKCSDQMTWSLKTVQLIIWMKNWTRNWCSSLTNSHHTLLEYLGSSKCLPRPSTSNRPKSWPLLILCNKSYRAVEHLQLFHCRRNHWSLRCCSNSCYSLSSTFACTSKKLIYHLLKKIGH